MTTVAFELTSDLNNADADTLAAAVENTLRKRHPHLMIRRLDTITVAEATEIGSPDGAVWT